MPSKILERINSLDRKLNKVEEIEEHLDKLVVKEEEDVAKITKEETKIEKSLLKIGNFTVKKSHLLELARGTAGAFLGVGVGQALGYSVTLAKNIQVLNALGILAFVLILVGLLIYKNDQTIIQQHKNSAFKYVTQKLVTLYLIAIFVEVIGLFLFNNYPGWNQLLFKTLIVGSYAAMSSAVAFTLI